MYSRDELFLLSLECYICVYFPRCFATQEINTKITLSWALKQFVTRVHTLFSIYWGNMTICLRALARQIPVKSELLHVLECWMPVANHGTHIDYTYTETQREEGYKSVSMLRCITFSTAAFYFLLQGMFCCRAGIFHGCDHIMYGAFRAL